MRVLMVVPELFYSTSGTPLSAYHRARELEKFGVSVDILTYRGGADPPNLAGRLFRSRGPHFGRTIRPGPSKLKIWFDLLLFVTLIGRLLRGRYDALYGHEEGGFMCRIAGAVFRIPYVYDMHSSLPRQIIEWKFSSRTWVVELFRQVEAVAVRGACAVVAISPAVAEIAKEVDADAMVVTIVNYFGSSLVRSPITPDQVRERHGIARDARLVVYTGSFVPLQALDLLLAAVPSVIASVPQARFLLVGGRQAEIDEFNVLVEQLGIGNAVTLVPTRPEAEMDAYLRAADVLVSPRVIGINPPGKLFSYLGSGRPVVATNTLIHTQLLDVGCAVLTEPTAEGLAAGLVEVLRDPERARTVVAGAARFLEKHCSSEARRLSYTSLIESIKATKPGAA